jgi:hypothetical protein
MSATLAIAMSDPAGARSHLGALLRPGRRAIPALEKILRVLPVPEGLTPLAEALIANGHHHEAAQLLPDAIHHLRSIGKHAEAQRLEAHARTPTIP